MEEFRAKRDRYFIIGIHTSILTNKNYRNTSFRQGNGFKIRSENGRKR